MKEINKGKIISAIITSIIGVFGGLGLIISAYVLNFNKNAFSDSPAYIYVMYILGTLILLIGLFNVYYLASLKFNIKKMTVKQMSVISVFTALSVILYYFGKFNLPFFPSWLDIQFSDVPALIISFIYGPLSGGLLIILRFFAKLPATMTVGVGEFADLIIGLTLTTVAGLIYKKHHTFKGAICAMLFGMISATIMACVANWLILIPAYIKIAGFSKEALVGMMSYIKGINTSNFMPIYIFAGVLPFNLFRYLLVFLITLVLYKRLHMFIEYITR